MKPRYVFWLIFMLLAVVVFALFLRALSAGISHPATAAAVAPALHDRAEERQEIIFLLQYIRRDYQNAVAHGRVISDFEYREMQAFSQRLLELYLSFQSERRPSYALFQLQQLREMVHEKAERAAIRELTTALVRDLSGELGVASSPAQPPDIERGRQLYAASGCGICHGPGGAGDGRAAAWLEPGPGSFRDPETMRDSTPFQFFNAIQFGVTGTGMPSFREAFTPAEVWDIAFYLMTLREDFAPQPGATLEGISLADLAATPDIDLQEKLKIRSSSPTDLQPAIDYLRRHPGILPFGSHLP